MKPQRALLEALEPRILYSADLAAVLGAAAERTPVLQQLQQLQELQQPSLQTQTAPHELAFVDLALPDAAALMAGLAAQQEAGRSLLVIGFAGHEDGLAVIGQALQQQHTLGQAVSAVHLFSHGSAGQVQLGAVTLDAPTALQRASELAQWSTALGSDADLLIYGCSVDASGAGQDLLQTLAALTGADVAASSDATGSALRGGNWLLESHSGAVQTSVAVAGALQQSWPGLLGNEFQVNITQNNSQNTLALTRGSQQAVALDAAGNYVVVWTSQNQDGDSDGVFARRFAWNGTPLTGEIQVNTSAAGPQNQARVVSDAAGNFVVVWSGNIGANTGTGVFMRRFDGNGTALTGERLVNTHINGDQTNPVLAMNRSSGEFVVAWEGEGATDSYGIYFRRFGATGTALDATAVQANRDDNGSEANPAIAISSAGHFVIAYDVGSGVVFQRFNASGAAQGGPAQMNGLLTSGEGAAVAMDGAGNFALAFTGGQLLSSGVWLQSFHADGSTRTGGAYVDTGDATSPSLAMASDGAFVVTYQKTGSNSTEIMARKYNANGSANGAAFAVNQATAGAQEAPSVALLGGNDFVVVWSGKTPGDSSGVMARSFEAPAAAPVITSHGGGASASLSVAEGSTAVTTVTATDSNLPAQTLGYSISGGTDAARFAIDSSSGALRYVTAPVFTSPSDANANNVYEVTVRASDGALSDTQALSVTVLKVTQAPLTVADSYTVAEDQTLAATVPSGWYDAAWALRQPITLNNASGGALTDTAVLVTLNSSSVDYSRTQNSGQDLRFVSSSGQLLAHDIELWDEAGTSRVWVRVPSIAAASTTGSFWMYTGNATAADGQQVAQTWPAGTGGAAAVVHLSSTLADASAAANVLTQSNTTVATGQVGQARQFDGASSWVSLGSAAAVDDLFLGGGTFTAWINPSSWGEAGFGRIASKADTTFATTEGNGWNLQLDGNSQRLLFEAGFAGNHGEWFSPTGSITLNTWQQVTVVYDNSAANNAPLIYINGAAVTVTSSRAPAGAPTSDAALPLRIGNQALTTDRTFAGRIDEVRVYDGQRSAAQTAADHRAATGALVGSVGAAQVAVPGVLNNDDARSGGAMTAELVSGPAHASSFSLNANGLFSYTPAANHFGADSFSYRARNSAVAGDTVVVSLNITPVADAPVFSYAGGAASAGVAVAEGGTTVATLTATDVDGQPPALAWSITGGADAARFVVDGATGALRFAAAPRFEAPLDAGANSVYDVVVQVSDGALADTLALAVSVTDVAYAPVAAGDAYAVNRDAVLSVPVGAGVLTNDSDPDGDALSVVSVGPAAHGLVSLTPAALPAYTNLSNHAATDTRPAWSPDGSRIAFDTARDGNNEIYLMAANGSGLTRLTNHAADDSQAAWSPDGSRIAFMSNRDGNHDLWLMNADGTGLVQLAATASGTSGQPAWSPNGSQLAFTSDRSGGGNFEVYVVNTDGSGLLRLTTTAGNDHEPAWSPDGSRIAFTSRRDGNSEIYTMNADGSGQVRLTNDAAADHTPAWSGDGRKLAFISDRSGVQQITVMDSDGSHPVAVTSSTTGLGFARWSASGNRLVFTHESDIHTATLSYPGSLVYTPNPGYAGNDSFSYTLADSTGLTANGTVSVTVMGSAIAAQDDSAATSQGVPISVNVLANDTAGPGGPLQLLDVSEPAQGKAVISGNQLLYTPNTGITGNDAARYLVTDGAQQLLHYWRLDGNGADALGAGAAVLQGGPATVPGHYGSALAFDGVDDLVRLPDLNYSSEFTLSFWFKLADNNGTQFRTLYSHGTPGDAGSLNVFFIEAANTTQSGAQNVLRTRLLDSNDAENLAGLDISATGLADNVWHQYTLATTTGGGTRVYIDGSLRASVASGGDTFNPNGDAVLGSLNSPAAGRYLNGALDGVALYTRSLNDAEVLAQSGTGARTAALALTVLPPVQTAPAITSSGGGAAATLTINENTLAVATVQALDTDLPAQGITYSISGGADAALFEIKPVTGVLVLRNAPNFEAPTDADGDNTYRVQVLASDGVLVDTQDLAVQVQDADEFGVGNPVDSNPSANAVLENAAPGSTVGVVAQAFDADGSNNSVTYSLDNSAGGLFSIDSASGVVRVAGALDTETARNHLVTVRALSSDGSWRLGSFSIEVQDVNEFALSPLADADAAPNTVDETSPVGSPVGLTALAFDPDSSSNQVRYSLLDDAGGRFAIDAGSGVLSLARVLSDSAGEEGLASHSVTVQAVSADGSQATQAYTVGVGLVNNHAPLITSFGGAATVLVVVDEGRTAVAGITATDTDLPAEPLLYQLHSGADAALFNIDAATGLLSFINAANFEAPTDANADGVYELTVSASDGQRAAQQSLRVQVRDVAEPPRWLPGPGANSLVISEGGRAVPALLLADEDTAPALLALQVQGASGGQFEFTHTPGVAVTVFTQADWAAGSLHFVADGGEAAPAYSLLLSDGSSTLPASAATVTFTPVNDAPVPGLVNLGAVAEDGLLLISLAQLLEGAFDAEGAALQVNQLRVESGQATVQDLGNGLWRLQPAADWHGTLQLAFVLDDGSGTATAQAQSATQVLVQPLDDAPAFHAPAALRPQPGSTGPAQLAVPENSGTVATIVATDVDTATAQLRYSIADGADAALFAIDSESGALSFRATPNFEQPQDANRDGRYELVLAVHDGVNTTLQALAVGVANTDEAPVLTSQQLLWSEQGATLKLQATDPDGQTAALAYDVVTTQGGHFEWQANAAQAGTVATRFTQADVDAGRVRFVLAASGQPGFQLALNDGGQRLLLPAPEVLRVPVPAAPVQAENPAAAGLAAPTPAVPSNTTPTANPAPDARTAPAERSPAVTEAAPPDALQNAAPPPGLPASGMAAPRAASAVPAGAAAAPAAAAAAAQTSTNFWSQVLATLELAADGAPLLREGSSADFSGSRNASAWAAAMDATRVHSEQNYAALELGGAGTVLVSSGLSVGYVLWLARGGALVASLMSSVPAWASVDPLPVLSQMRQRGAGADDDSDTTEDDDIDPIERLFSRARRLLPGTAAAAAPAAQQAQPTLEEATA